MKYIRIENLRWMDVSVTPDVAFKVRVSIEAGRSSQLKAGDVFYATSAYRALFAVNRVGLLFCICYN